MNTKYVYALQCKTCHDNLFVYILQTRNRIITMEQFEEIEHEIFYKEEVDVININFLHQFEED
jgi:hypothetical protein